MKFALADPASGYIINACNPEEIRVAGGSFQRSLVVAPDRIGESWGPDNIADLTLAHIKELRTYEPEILLLGTGPRQVFPEPELYLELVRDGIGFEVMTTDAACRTYNILISEGRRAVAALIMEN